MRTIRGGRTTTISGRDYGMRLLISLLMVAAAVHATGATEAMYGYAVLGSDAGSWPDIFSSIGLQSQPAEKAQVIVANAGITDSELPRWTERIERGAILILEGESPLGKSVGFHPSKTSGKISIHSIGDIHGPDVAIVWEKSLELPVFDVPSTAIVFARERKRSPLK